MKKYFLILFLGLSLCGCATMTEIKIDNIKDINLHPYQIVGYYEADIDGYTTRVIIARHWIKKINKDKYYYEFLIKEPLTRMPFYKK